MIVGNSVAIEYFKSIQNVCKTFENSNVTWNITKMKYNKLYHMRITYNELKTT